MSRNLTPARTGSDPHGADHHPLDREIPGAERVRVLHDGRIVRAFAAYENGVVRFTAWADDRGLVLDIQDEGVGIEPEMQALLFRKYEKMNAEQSGQGIGLFMVKQLTDHFGGRIELASEPGHGTRVRIALPLFRP